MEQSSAKGGSLSSRPIGAISSIATRCITHHIILHCVQKKNTYSHFLSYLHELFVDLNKNCSEYTQGLIDSDNVKKLDIHCDR